MMRKPIYAESLKEGQVYELENRDGRVASMRLLAVTLTEVKYEWVTSGWVSSKSIDAFVHSVNETSWALQLQEEE
jgi:hypothetical protein